LKKTSQSYYANAYNPNIGQEEVKHREPREILSEIEKLYKETEKQMKRMKGVFEINGLHPSR